MELVEASTSVNFENLPEQTEKKPDKPEGNIWNFFAKNSYTTREEESHPSTDDILNQTTLGFTTGNDSTINRKRTDRKEKPSLFNDSFNEFLSSTAQNYMRTKAVNLDDITKNASSVTQDIRSTASPAKPKTPQNAPNYKRSASPYKLFMNSRGTQNQSPTGYSYSTTGLEPPDIPRKPSTSQGSRQYYGNAAANANPADKASTFMNNPLFDFMKREPGSSGFGEGGPFRQDSRNEDPMNQSQIAREKELIQKMLNEQTKRRREMLLTGQQFRRPSARKEESKENIVKESSLGREERERETYITLVINYKPWLEASFLQLFKFDVLKLGFPIPKDAVPFNNMDEDEKQEFAKEMVYIKETVWANRNQPKETKTDAQLANDLRYYGKHGEYLMKRISGRNYYERLGTRTHHLS